MIERHADPFSSVIKPNLNQNETCFIPCTHSTGLKHKTNHSDQTFHEFYMFIISVPIWLIMSAGPMLLCWKPGWEMKSVREIKRDWGVGGTRWPDEKHHSHPHSHSPPRISLPLCYHVISSLSSSLVSPAGALRRNAELPKAASQSDREVFTGSNEMKGWFTWANHVHQSVQESHRALFRPYSLPLTLPIPA